MVRMRISVMEMVEVQISARDVGVLPSSVEADVDEVVTPMTETDAVRELDHRAPTHDVETAEHPSHGDDHDSLDAPDTDKRRREMLR